MMILTMILSSTIVDADRFCHQQQDCYYQAAGGDISKFIVRNDGKIQQEFSV